MEIITDILTGIQDHLVAVITTGVFTIGAGGITFSNVAKASAIFKVKKG